ncbi:hypothetical protein KRR23_08190 [Pseudomonas sp. CVAP|uniref:hypothetical protein n=1 Tax=Pseudomonas sp. CVAP\|nr:hypothetical protein [Pseudomonas sp. CVAP\
MSNDKESALEEGDVGSTIALDPLQIQRYESEELFDTVASIVFNVPQSDGEHQVWIQYFGPDYFEWISEGEWYKGVRWNIKENTNFPQGQGFYVTWWNYYEQQSPSRRKYIFVASKPRITTYDQTINSVRGVEGRFGALRVVEHITAREMSSTFSSSGSWSKTLHAHIRSGRYQVVIEEKIPEHAVRYSSPLTIECIRAPDILLPAEQASLANQVVTIRGNNGLPGAVIQIVNQSGSFEWGRGVVKGDGSWEVSVDFTYTYISVTIYARHTLGNLTKSSRTYTLPASEPIITSPSPNSIVDLRESISGSRGIAGATIKVRKDFDSSFILGQCPVEAGGLWTLRTLIRDMIPGPFSVVAEQVLNGGPSGVSKVQSFKVRPAKLAVTVTPLPNEQVKFSGSGYTGATVEITKVSGPGEAVLLTSEVKKDAWEVTVTGWVPGSYVLSAIQKVPDKPSGWILSQDYRFDRTWEVASPTDVTYTVVDYTPTFSGKGYTGATVVIAFEGGATAAPNVEVVGGGWSSTASQVWGPTTKRKVHIRQGLNDRWSVGWVEILVTIPLLAPEITITDDGSSPIITGTCWPGAVVNLTYSDSATVHNPSGASGTWTFQRTDHFAHDVTHTVTVTQTFDSQTSESASEMFTIPLPKLDITSPEPGKDEEVGPDLIVKGDNGVKCATVKIRDAQNSSILGSRLLSADGPWSVALDERLAFRRYSIDATQSNSVRESERSEVCTFRVVLLPPTFEVPQPGGDLPRTSIISGQGLPGARVSVWRQGNPVPLLHDILVDENGHWEGPVMLFLVGEIVIQATQTVEQQTSKDSPPLTCNVVPNAPFMETPAPDEFVQDEVVCSGFGYTDNTGDTVTVALADAPQTALGQVQVLADRSWSIRITLARPGGIHKLIAVQSRDGFASAPSPERLIRLGAYQPLINVPAEGCWVTDPVAFEGKGLDGMGKLFAWFNPELKLARDIVITEADWQATAQVELRRGGYWVCFQQRLAGGTESSRRAESARFEVESPKPSSE